MLRGMVWPRWARAHAGDSKGDDDVYVAKDKAGGPPGQGGGGRGEVVVEMGEPWRAEEHKDMLRRREGGPSEHTLPGDPAPLHSAHQRAAQGGGVGAQQSSPSTGQVLAFAGVLLGMVLIIYSIPPISSVKGGEDFVWRPSKVEHFKLDKDLMIAYRDKHAVSLFVGMCVVYIILQTFCVPGSGTTLNLLAGCIYAEYVPWGEYLIALPFCVFCSTVGAVMAYNLSFFTAREVLLRRYPTRINWLRSRIGDMEPQAKLFFFMSLRLSPLIPAWFLNLAAPMTPLPVWMFAIATMVGCTPSSLLLVKTGAMIPRLRPGEDPLKGNYWQLLMLLLLAIAVFSIPFIVKRRLSLADPDVASGLDERRASPPPAPHPGRPPHTVDNVGARMV